MSRRSTILFAVLVVLPAMIIREGDAAAPKGSSSTASSSAMRTTASATASAIAAASAPASFTVATYNINFGNPDLKGVVANILKAGADVVLLQETNDESAAYLRGALTKQYPYMSFRSGEAAGGFGFLSKVPLKNVRYLPPKFGWFGTYVAEAEIGGVKVTLVSVHLLPSLPKQDSVLSVVPTFLAGEATRTKELQLILQAVPKDKPVILGGDFNTLSWFGTIRLALGAGYVDSLAAGSKGAVPSTWEWTIGGKKWDFRLDYVLHNKFFQTAGAKVYPSDASDHFLVACELRHAKPTSQPASASTVAGGQSGE